MEDRPRKKPKTSGFILEEAEVDDDEDEDDEPEEGYEDLVDHRDSNYMAEDGPTAADIEGRRRRMEMWE